MKSKSISVTEAIDKYYNSHKSKLDKLFGGPRQAKAQLENMPGIPASKFRTRSHATAAFNDFVKSREDPFGYTLKQAKAEALHNTPNAFSKAQQLNRRIDKKGFITKSKSLGSIDGKNANLIGYYDIKNSNYVLANVSLTSGRNTEIEYWQFLQRSSI